jgi:polyphosphate glucokinase
VTRSVRFRSATPPSGGGGLRTLVVDVGGIGIKLGVFDREGERIGEFVRVPTPVEHPPARYLRLLEREAAKLPSFERISVGFPGVIRDGTTRSAPNLRHRGWEAYPLGCELENLFRRPTRVVNDADLAGLGVVSGVGLEMVATLGTGFGTGLYRDGRLAPHLEIGRSIFLGKTSYDEFVGDAACRRLGDRRWSRRVLRVVERLRQLTDFDRLYLGGGNSRRIVLELPRDVSIVTNEQALRGGVFLWAK